ncbi:hypothetical protein IEQ34_016432 [Dendrobium chrysotoxum]|uniref:Formamidase n=1 Tax=Dendrobium chrysotoxum TaxID=161865 RepID=A0AAV7GFK0_DENCH|nr:hypothetical protein IEQ34_016432 [Dendrobium chrysotoxum]
MAPPSPRLVVPIDLKKKPWEQKYPLHNRWHPRIPAVAEVTEGELFRVEMMDWSGGSIADNDSAMDIKSMDLAIGHCLSGPIRVVDKEGVPAKPGDLLAIEICNLGPLPGDEWGYTATYDRENGGGFLTDHFPSATKAIWYFEGIYTYSPHIPGVRFPGLNHPGLIGTAPSIELLNIWNERERKLVENGPNSLKICEINEGTSEWEKVANEAARTIPGRENGGNCDIKNLSTGSKLYLPVFVEGANLSAGDMHFSQGDGEISLCGAIEMSGYLELKVEAGRQRARAAERKIEEGNGGLEVASGPYRLRSEQASTSHEACENFGGWRWHSDEACSCVWKSRAQKLGSDVYNRWSEDGREEARSVPGEEG